MKCEQCGKFMSYIITNHFNHDGTDSDIRMSLKIVPEDAVIFETDTNWCGYGLTEEEQREHIRCPHCGKFPFKHQEIQIEEVVRVVMFKQIDNG